MISVTIDMAATRLSMQLSHRQGIWNARQSPINASRMVEEVNQMAVCPMCAHCLGDNGRMWRNFDALGGIDVGKTVEIRLSPDGSVTAETHGMTGKSCLAYMALLEELMQASVVDSEFTKDFYAQETVVDEEGLDTILEQNLA